MKVESTNTFTCVHDIFLRARPETISWCMACLLPYKLSGQVLETTGDVQLDKDTDVCAVEQLSDEKSEESKKHPCCRNRRLEPGPNAS